MAQTIDTAAGRRRTRVNTTRAPHAADALESDVVAPAPPLVARFWGVRGSHPVVAAGGSRVGVNTACVELRWGGQVIVLDAGSGIIPLGERLVREWQRPGVGASGGRPPSVAVLFTHAHHDHICGLPFFAPLFVPNARVQLFGPDLAGMRFGEIVSGYMRSPYFPVDFADLPPGRSVRSVAEGTRLVWRAGAREPLMRRLGAPAPADALVIDVLHGEAHPRNGVLVYRVSAGGRSLAFATDLEMDVPQSAFEQRLARFVEGTDVLIHDAQYAPADYDGPDSHRGYGHSTPAMACRVAAAAHARELVLFHADPGYGDGDVEALEAGARRIFAPACVAREGMEIWLDGAGVRHVV